MSEQKKVFKTWEVCVYKTAYKYFNVPAATAEEAEAKVKKIIDDVDVSEYDGIFGPDEAEYVTEEKGELDADYVDLDYFGDDDDDEIDEE